MNTRKAFQYLCLVLIITAVAAAPAWADREGEARTKYNQALILLQNHEAVKAEALLKTISSDYTDTRTATDAIMLLGQMKSARTVEKTCDTNAKVTLIYAITALKEYYKLHKTYVGFFKNETAYTETGFFLADPKVVFEMAFCNEKGYAAKAYHPRGEHLYAVKGPAKNSSDIIELPYDRADRLLEK